MKPTSLTTIAAMLVFGIGGFFAGRASSPEKDNDSGAGSPQTRATRSLAGSAASGAADAEAARRAARAERSARASSRGGETSGLSRNERLESIIRDEHALDRSRAFMAFIDQLGPGDFEDAVAHFRSLGITERRFGEYAMLLSAWAETDPIAAMEYVGSNTSGPFARETVVSVWASRDPQAAIRWAEANHSGDGANPHIAGIIRGIGGSDPLLATQLMTSMPRSEERGRALDAFLPHLLARGTEETRAWVDSLADDALRNGAMLRVAEQLAAQDPAATAAWLMANPGEASQRRIDDVYSVWAGQDERSALNSLASLPGGENRSNALRGVVGNVASRDPQAAISLMDRYSADVTDGVVRNFIWQTFGNDPSTAVAQIARIADQPTRDQTYRRTMEFWLRRDQAAATDWMRRNPLPAAVQEELNRRMNDAR